ncbi:iron-sulfur cluster repair di-iron protein [Sphingobacterium mizutaii NBRC 14946 = DSM 11724]|uniref:Cell wall-related protein ScdA n=2 Tax=Sphingobacterium mizutaii TaxID=1010 RepID=A0AAJ4XD99_9SPHI|nr:iron-sulfur cluster repair di-iron protein [Sphingobacterium mizutaii]GEM70195.1 iron-sulfur cluster repair di-iron protein [Sphingobacterium mizutaii NBRC 14946 = DSM 11724]SDL91763.1 regulator of cell morphogenesis and NO signaling [Sphingobacterium mizutaii]SNV55656.1 Cell wall-related protein ScdA [Sphingobacterium mizutaii]
MENLINEKIGNVVAKNFKTAAVFTKYGMDFCCGGQVAIGTVADKKGINKESLLDDLNNVLNESAGEQIDFNSWPSDLLVSYIVKTHHRYVREKTPVLMAYINKVARVHGERHPELYEINKLFEESALDLGHHMEKEEKILFPYIEKLEETKSNPAAYVQPGFGSVQNPISMMIHEHETEGGRFAKIAELSDNYTAPEDACNTYRVAFDMLRDFEQDLHKHIHLENNILFPKSIRLEENTK